jgi:hypothetical protein
MVFNATFNNISVTSWWSVLLVEETEAAILQYNGILLCRTNVESTHCKSYWSTVINRKYNQEEI